METDFWAMLLQLSLMGRALRAEKDEPEGKFEIKVDPYEYRTCDDHWDVKYPYLVEVRFTAEPTERFVHHKSRHGVLISHRAVLTRAQDLDKFPNSARGERTPTTDLKACMAGGGENPCLYINTRRPMNKKDPPQMCGQNIIVKEAKFHPKWTRTARDVRDDVHLRFENMKFPFAILVLMTEVNITMNQTIFPSLVLPRSPLDLMYLSRRVATIGHDSKLCEFPHFKELKYGKGYYGQYDTPEKLKVNPLDCKKDRRTWESDKRQSNVTLCVERSLCPPDSSGNSGCSWEGFRQPAGSRTESDCRRTLLWPNLHKNSLMVFFTTKFNFVEGGKVDSPLRRSTDGPLGSPIVCDGVGIGIVSSFVERGWNRKDAYVGTNFLRGWRWILEQQRLYQNLSWHRASDDSPFLGEKYRFLKKAYPKRVYEESFFDTDHVEQIAVLVNGGQRWGSLIGTVFFISVLISFS